MKFIIADESVFFRNYFSKQILLLGHTVLGEAKEGQTLVEKVRKLKPDFVVTDVGMSPMNGLDASMEIYKLMPEVKIICITLQNISSWISEMQQIGISGYVYKNSGNESLYNAIKSSLNNTFYCDTMQSKFLINDLKKIFHSEDSGVEGLSQLKTGLKSLLFQPQSRNDENGYIPSKRELIILTATAEGKPIKQIAELLGITARNISKIKEKMRDKTGVETNAELLSISYKNGWI